MTKTDNHLVVLLCIIIIGVPVIGCALMAPHPNCHVHPELQARCASR